MKGVRQMAKEKKPVTKIDPRKELSPYLNHISDRQKKKKRSLNYLPHFQNYAMKDENLYLSI